mmetsp:Transcript_35476/g.31974  ORF Transcript_35476/g.31974 Transcript_35476/m.31974 type:complete len:93 (-) Transcript_35476:35-313(-)
MDQEGKNVKLYVKLPEIGRVDTANISFHATQESFELKIHGYNNANWIFGKSKLNAAIVPEKSKFVKKENKIIVTLCKVKDGHWSQLGYKQSK